LQVKGIPNNRCLRSINAKKNLSGRKIMAIENKVRDLLIEMGICKSETIEPYYPRVRDRNDVAVLKCKESGVIFLSRSDHMDISHYSEKADFSYWGAQDREAALASGKADAERRYDQFQSIIANKIWLDVGTGAGGILDYLSPVAKETAAVEPQEAAKNYLNEIGHKTYSSVDDVEDGKYEVVTLFHVLEHLTDPIGTLIAIRKKMVKGGKIIIEIPHANDFLISFLEHEAFKAFTFWSEHLILHTKESVRKFMEAAGFTNIVVSGYQRYPLSNHLHWLARNKPGGHVTWAHLSTEALDHAYTSMLAGIDKTDTLIVNAEN
jgi:2-polyprenyl-3-methyl-5-hydroxy-6-metoxy-1,4-benzoquinol methylase